MSWLVRDLSRGPASLCKGRGGHELKELTQLSKVEQRDDDMRKKTTDRPNP